MSDDLHEIRAVAGAEFAELIEASRADIIDDYIRRLEEIESPFSRDPKSRTRAMENAAEILTDVVSNMRMGTLYPDRVRASVVCDIEESPGAHCLHVREEMRASSILFQAAIHYAARRVASDVGSLRSYAFFVLALNQCINLRTREAANAYTGYLLNKIHEAHTLERRRIARELRDRAGRIISRADRQLELYESNRAKGRPGRARCRVETVQRSILESMENLRQVTGDLRRKGPERSLETALAAYIESTSTDADVRLRVSGDEAWAPPEIRDESFFVIRQAIGDALTYDSPTVVLVGVEIIPGELRMWVEDDGRGPGHAQQSAADRKGLVSMRERAVLMGGTIRVSAECNRRNLLELLVPLPGHRDDAIKC